MKLLSSLLFVVLFSGTLWSQEKIDQRLLKVYSVTELNEMIQSSPDDYQLLVYALDNAIYYTNYSTEKSLEFTAIDRPKDGVTFLDLGLELKEVNQYFKVNGENQLLVVKSKWVLNHELNK